MQDRLIPLLETAIAELCRDAVPGSLRIADLGCSSGSNALALVSSVVTAVRHQQGAAAADRCYEISVYLNDLPDNDFNAAFKAVPSFLREHGETARGDGPLVMVFGAPGSFYGRLFPAKTMHLVCSSFSVHWLSKVTPIDLLNNTAVNFSFPYGRLQFNLSFF